MLRTRNFNRCRYCENISW